jgi:DNA glycosylase AlkZ-like
LRILNRRILASQFLSKKASGPRAVVKVAEACCGINSQDFLESFSSFWVRIDGFKDSDLNSELRPKGDLVRAYAVRGTMHTIPSKDYWIHVFGGPRKRFLPGIDNIAKKRGIPDRDSRIRLLYEPFLDHIKGRAVTSNEIEEFMVDKLTQLGLPARMKLRRGWQSQPTYGPTWMGFSEMSFLGLLVNAGRRGSESLWMGSSDWLGSGRTPPDPEECTVELIRRYIECYGPVTREDIVYWTFLRKSDVNVALETLKKDLIKERIDGNEEYFSLGDSGEAFEAPQALVLPEFDSLMMGYKDKSRFLPDKHLKKVFLSLARIERTILLDGFVAATWKRKKSREGMMVQVSPLRTLKGREKRSIEEEFSRYSDYQGTKILVDIKK